MDKQHQFQTVESFSDYPIMFCAHCGLSYQLVSKIVSGEYFFYWRRMSFVYLNDIPYAQPEVIPAPGPCEVAAREEDLPEEEIPF